MMKLSDKAMETGRFLVQALERKKIERRFSFLIIRERGRVDHTKPVNGVLDMAFRIPVAELESLLELQEAGLITISGQDATEHDLWDVWLHNELLDLAESQPAASYETPRIFISYSSQDDRIEEQLETELRRIQPNIWTDRGFRGGERVWDDILQEIARCDVFVYLLSPDSIKSFACRTELSEAIRWDKHIIPLIIRPTEIPAYIKTVYSCKEASKDNVNQMCSRLSTAIDECELVSDGKEASKPLWHKPEKIHIESSQLKVVVKVPARIEPTIEQKERLNTGTLLLEGEKISISATGTITNDMQNGQGRTWISPEGVDQWGHCSKDNHAYWNSFCVGALVGWVNGINDYDLSIPIGIGTTSIGQNTSVGFLYLAVNDSIYDDNGGEFTVTITVTRN